MFSEFLLPRKCDTCESFIKIKTNARLRTRTLCMAQCIVLFSACKDTTFLIINTLNHEKNYIHTF